MNCGFDAHVSTIKNSTGQNVSFFLQCSFYPWDYCAGWMDLNDSIHLTKEPHFLLLQFSQQDCLLLEYVWAAGNTTTGQNIDLRESGQLLLFHTTCSAADEAHGRNVYLIFPLYFILCFSLPVCLSLCLVQMHRVIFTFMRPRLPIVLYLIIMSLNFFLIFFFSCSFIFRLSERNVLLWPKQSNSKPRKKNRAGIWQILK